MRDTLLRLAWALPLVLAIGGGIVCSRGGALTCRPLRPRVSRSSRSPLHASVPHGSRRLPHRRFSNERNRSRTRGSRSGRLLWSSSWCVYADRSVARHRRRDPMFRYRRHGEGLPRPFPGMAKVMKANEAANPEEVCLFCPQAIVTVANALAQLIQEPCGSQLWTSSFHQSVSTVCIDSTRVNCSFRAYTCVTLAVQVIQHLPCFRHQPHF
jgi:hypothetical protein